MENIHRVAEANTAYEKAVEEAYKELMHDINELAEDAMDREDKVEYALLASLSLQCMASDVYRTPSWLIERQLESVARVVRQIKTLKDS